jgi:hypothetical protein
MPHWKANVVESKPKTPKTHAEPIIWAVKFKADLSFVLKTKPSSYVPFGLVKNVTILSVVK